MYLGLERHFLKKEDNFSTFFCIRLGAGTQEKVASVRSFSDRTDGDLNYEYAVLEFGNAAWTEARLILEDGRSKSDVYVIDGEPVTRY